MGPTLRASLAFVPLWLAAFFGFFGSIRMGTCTGGAADAFAMGLFVLVLNLVGMALIAKGTSRGLLICVLSVPMLVALSYTAFTIQLVEGVSAGQTACTILLGEEFPMVDGREATFAWQWTTACLVFWGGAALSIRNSVTRSFKTDDPDQ
jgi:hypothetical protein